MTALDKAALERIDSFRSRMEKYKEVEGATLESLAEECEVSLHTMRAFLKLKQKPSCLCLIKMAYATGIEL